MPAVADLGPGLEEYVTTLVRDGRYGSRDEVLREGVRLLARRDERLASLDEALARGLADAEAGRVKPIAEVRDRLMRRFSERTKSAT